MPTKNPRVITTLDYEQREWLREVSSRKGISISLLLRDIVREAQDLAEDRYWSREGEERLKTFDRKKAGTSKDVWD